jgi:RND family efflux transporter MFP subunit
MPCRLLRVGLIAGVIASSALLPAFAEERSNRFPVSSEQMRALGVELVSLAVQPDTAGARFPAQVVLPPQAEQVVSAPVAGLINQVLVQENQAVTPGMPLLVLSSPELGRLQLALVQAASRARLTSQAIVRERELFKEGIIAQRRVDEASAAARDADAELIQARAALELAGVSKADTAGIASAAQVKSELTLTAKAGGIVTMLTAKPGQRVAVADPLLHLVRVDTLWLDVQIPSGEASRWTPGSTLRIAGGVEAKVLSVSPVASSAQTVLLRAQLGDGAGHLRPGEFIQAELPLATGDAWDVPIEALAREGEQAYVFVREDGTFVATEVTILTSAGQRAKVSGTLRAGQQIAVSSVIALKAAWQGLGGAEEE